MAQIDPIWSDRMLSVLRIIAALLFLQHGLAKYFGFPHVAAFDNLKVLSLVGLAGAIEIVGSVLLLLGLFTRPAAFIMSGEMAFAYFMSHAPRGFFPHTERRGACRAVLFRLPVLCNCRRRSLEPGPIHQKNAGFFCAERGDVTARIAAAD